MLSNERCFFQKMTYSGSTTYATCGIESGGGVVRSSCGNTSSYSGSNSGGSSSSADTMQAIGIMADVFTKTMNDAAAKAQREAEAEAEREAAEARRRAAEQVRRQAYEAERARRQAYIDEEIKRRSQDLLSQAASDPSTNPWASRSSGKSQSGHTFVAINNTGGSNRGGRTLVDQYGVACIKVVSSKPITKPYEKSTYTIYEYVFQNRCNKGISLELQANSGSTSYIDVPAGKTKKWTCTDGIPVNKDCNGGLSSYIEK
jgi:hypothetical protein